MFLLLCRLDRWVVDVLFLFLLIVNSRVFDRQRQLRSSSWSIDRALHHRSLYRIFYTNPHSRLTPSNCDKHHVFVSFICSVLIYIIDIRLIDTIMFPSSFSLHLIMFCARLDIDGHLQWWSYGSILIVSFINRSTLQFLFFVVQTDVRSVLQRHIGWQFIGTAWPVSASTK